MPLGAQRKPIHPWIAFPDEVAIKSPLEAYLIVRHGEAMRERHSVEREGKRHRGRKRWDECYPHNEVVSSCRGSPGVGSQTVRLS